jgi:hypothetical protein
MHITKEISEPNISKIRYTVARIPVLFYGPERWEVTTGQRRRLETIEKWVIIRNIAGYRTKTHERKEDIME